MKSVRFSVLKSFPVYLFHKRLSLVTSFTNVSTYQPFNDYLIGIFHVTPILKIWFLPTFNCNALISIHSRFNVICLQQHYQKKSCDQGKSRKRARFHLVDNFGQVQKSKHFFLQNRTVTHISILLVRTNYFI